MTTTYLPVTCQLVGTVEDWTVAYSPLHREFTDRAEAFAWGIEELGHDDFRLATLVDGKLAAIGWGTDDFDPVEEDLPDIARQLARELA